ncbi:ABC transporter permease [Streptomyces sp. NPDC048506]|uniref:ABC transporter permease n=1 Tax=Streptomyces sp. NPDC048506 TaxID=3155028 RepID=UPI00343B1184
MTSTTAHPGAGGSGPARRDEDGRDERGGTAGSRTVRRRPSLRGPIWLVWRQHRMVLGVLLAGSAAGAVWCTELRGRMADFIDAHHIAGCSMISLVPRCAHTQDTVIAFRGSYGPALQLLELGLVLLPVLIGMFIGAPLIARELESGTDQLVLTQSVAPLRWLRAKVGLPALVVVIATSGFSAAFAWLWQVAGDEVSGSYWYSVRGFNALGPVPVAYALLGLATGVLVGLLLRRTVASMAVTMLAMVVVQFGLGQLRPYLMPTVTTEFRPGVAAQLPDDSWGLEQGFYTRSGAHLTDQDLACSPQEDYDACLPRHHVIGQYMDQHPVSHHWPLAWIEAGIVLALAAALTVFAFRVVRRRYG